MFQNFEEHVRALLIYYQMNLVTILDRYSATGTVLDNDQEFVENAMYVFKLYGVPLTDEETLNEILELEVGGE